MLFICILKLIVASLMIVYGIIYSFAVVLALIMLFVWKLTKRRGGVTGTN